MNDDVQKQNLAEMAAALGGHEITDDEGNQMPGETPDKEESAPQEEKTTDETEQVEPTQPAQAEEDDDAEAVDESGKRYIPEKRFKDVYAKLKAKERELEELRKQPPVTKPSQNFSTHNQETATKADKLELEILKEKYPQFDPESSEHSEVLDEMGFEIFQSTPGITRIEAARKAIARAKKLGMAEATIKTEARVVKAQQSDSGIANRVLNRTGNQPDPSRMNLKEKEEYLKKNGMWD